MSSTEHTEVHPFERAGLGRAPFKFAGLAQQDMCYGQAILNRAEVDAGAEFEITTKPGGTCAYCGTYIVVMCDIVSADGKRFHVGTDCAEKCCGPKLVAAVKREANKLKRTKRAAKSATQAAELDAILVEDAVRAKLESLPHPTRPGETLLGYAEWMVKRAGARGRANALRVIKEACNDRGLRCATAPTQRKVG